MSYNKKTYVKDVTIITADGLNNIEDAVKTLDTDVTALKSIPIPTKATLNLDKVDNTTDLEKPISTLTQGAFDTVNTALSDIPKYANMQLINLNKALNKINDNTSSFSIVTQGDSLTHGQDLLSLDARVYTLDATSVTGGSNANIGAYTYPESLKSALAQSYGSSRVSVLKRGYCGDTIELSYNRWTVDPTADVHIFMFGTNDYVTSDYSAYIANYYKLIKRVLEWGSSVVILIPPRKGSFSYKLDVLARELKSLGEVLNIPVVDTIDLFNGYSVDELFGSYSEGVHLNGAGYLNLGTRVASLFVGTKSMFKMKQIKSNNTLVCMPHSGYSAYNSATAVTFLPWGDRTIWGANLKAEGSAVKILMDGRVTLSFETVEDNMLFIPIFTAGTGANATITLDYNNDQPKALSSLYDNATVRTSLTASSKQLQFGAGISQKKTIQNFSISNIGTTILKVVSAGIHTINITNSTVSTTAEVVFEGFVCMSIPDFIAWKNNYLMEGLTLAKSNIMTGIATDSTTRHIASVNGLNLKYGDALATIVDIITGSNLFVTGHVLPNTDSGGKDLGATWKKWQNGYFSNVIGLGTFTTANRPTIGLTIGSECYDTTLGQPIYCSAVGVKEVDTLTLTTGATTAGNITITINGVATIIAVTASATVGAIGDIIRATAITGWTVGGTTGTGVVTFTKLGTGTNTTPTIADTGTTGTVGAFVVTTAGTNSTWKGSTVATV